MLHNVRVSVVGIKIGFYRLIPRGCWQNRRYCVHPLKLCTPLKQVEDPSNEAEHPTLRLTDQSGAAPPLGQEPGWKDLLPGSDGPNLPQLMLHKFMTDVSEHLKD